MDTPIDSFSPQEKKKNQKPKSKPQNHSKAFFKIFTSQLVNNCENYTILEKYLLRDLIIASCKPLIPLLFHHPGNFRVVFILLLYGFMTEEGGFPAKFRE